MPTPSPHPPSPELFFDVAFAHQKAAALKAAIELDVFTAIGDAPATADAVAGRLQVPARGVRMLCDYLTVLGFLTKADGTYQLTPDSAVFLTRTSPAYLGGTLQFLAAPAILRNLNRLTDTVRHGTVAPENNTVSVENPIWVDFARAMVPMMAMPAAAIADLLEVASAGPLRVLDLAAGHGIFGITIAERNKDATIVAVDWPAVLAVATEQATAHGVGARHQLRPGDAFSVDYGTGYDVALITDFLHHFDEPTNVRLLAKTAAALKPGGRVAILEMVPNEDRVSPPFAAGFAVTMLSGTPAGDAYTGRDLERMLTTAGFTAVTLYPLPGPQTVVLARRR